MQKYLNSFLTASLVISLASFHLLAAPAVPGGRIIDLPNRYPSGLYLSSGPPGSGDLMTFRVRGNNLQDLHFSINLNCFNPDVEGPFSVTFTSHTAGTPLAGNLGSLSSHPAFRPGGSDTGTPHVLLNSYGQADIANVPVTDSGRDMLMKLKVHVYADGHATAFLGLKSTGGSLDECAATQNFNLRRGTP